MATGVLSIFRVSFGEHRVFPLLQLQGSLTSCGDAPEVVDFFFYIFEDFSRGSLHGVPRRCMCICENARFLLRGGAVLNRDISFRAPHNGARLLNLF